MGGGFAAVGMVCGEIMTSPGFCRSYYGDVVLVEARRLCYGGAGSKLEIGSQRLCYVWCWPRTGCGFPETCRVE